MSLLAIKNLTVEYPSRKSTFTAVRDVTLSVERGEILGLVGESGAGKSTIGTAVMGLLDAPGRVAGGEILIDGQDARSIANLRGARVSMIFQDPLTSLNPLYTVAQQLTETIRTHRRMTRAEAHDEAVSLLDQVGIADAETRITQYPHQFSGGMRQRVVIALALCSQPDLIIADEPTTALDVSVQAQILDLIRDLAVSRGVGVILVTHDMGVIAQTADRVAVMYHGALVEEGKTAQIIHDPQHPYTQSLLAAVPRGERKLDRFPSLTYQPDGAPAPQEMTLTDDWLRSKGKDENQGTGPLVQVRGLGMRFLTRNAILPKNRSYIDAVKDLNFDINRGEVLGLVGESGSGKSTVARMIAGIHAPDTGSITFDGQDMAKIASSHERQALRRQIQMIFQDPYSSLNPRMRVRDIVAEPIHHNRLSETASETSRIVGDLLEVVGLGAAAGAKFPHEFSGGQRQRISIARALATRPRFLICDEPTSALDVSIQAQILNLLKDLRDALDLTILFISHDLPVVRQMCDRVAVMRNGQLCELAETEALFEAPRDPYTRELISLMPSL
ncbi:dipeptide ABC transporter ATP-binding protein [Litoreibacter albidus]|uniref:Peptide/nickel transport system ATP-binding protein n=1 Tax=Litoreibacter albidus TaxID=670155 RepID=A0A1H3CQW9_9RHOB|nr:ABC transporter ATP-binding protein [Litoreibacter albidus]SDX56537.1 peptide/nickel transport system ATP-binding protein [Litoreibacter albidus]